MVFPILGLMVGLLIGTFLPVSMPIEYAKYLSVALLSSLDSVFGGLRAGSEGKFDRLLHQCALARRPCLYRGRDWH